MPQLYIVDPSGTICSARLPLQGATFEEEKSDIRLDLQLCGAESVSWFVSIMLQLASLFVNWRNLQPKPRKRTDTGSPAASEKEPLWT
jgi:hypothetical protein